MKYSKEEEIYDRVKRKEKTSAFLRPLMKFLLWAAFVCICLWGLYYWFSSFKNTKTYTPSEETVLTVAEQRVLDSDGDGLEDWQEDLYGTSNKLRDTDGDGLLDGQEVALGYDPNYYGEGLLDGDVLPQKKVFEDYVFESTNSQSSFNFDPVTNSFLQNSGDDEVKKIIKQSVNVLGAIIGKHSFADMQNVDLFGSLFVKDLTTSQISDLRSVVDAYRTIAEEIGSLNYHVTVDMEARRLQQSYENVAGLLEKLIDGQSISSQQYQDLLLAYTTAVTEQQNALVAVHRIVTAHGIKYISTEPGSFFLFEL